MEGIQHQKLPGHLLQQPRFDFDRGAVAALVEAKQ
jgi:hypothetical protein